MLERHVIGVDLGATNISAGRIESGKIEDWVEFPISTDKEENVIIQEVISAIEKVRTSSTKAIGIGVPSVVDTEKGIVFDVQNIPSWKEVHLKEIIENVFNVAAHINNDANCFVMGEKYFGEAKKFSNIVGLTLGSGLGGGIIINNSLYEGKNCGAGEFGSLPYLDGILENYCSGQFFLRAYDKSGKDMFTLAKNGDDIALKSFKEFGYHIGNAILNVMYTFDPQAIILGGSIADAFNYFKETMFETIETFPYRKSVENIVVKKSEQKNITVLGAAALCMNGKL
ncbi:ROK family protein [bacterium]|nr:ROK family protein [bacterium]